MNPVLLKLVYDGQAEHPPTAWFIPGDDGAMWLTELIGWNVPHSQLRLGIVPRGFQDPRPAGVIVMGECLAQGPFNSAKVANVRVAATIPSPQCIGLRTVVAGLYIPCDGKLFPPATEVELRACFPRDRVTVWLPAQGPIAWETNELLRLADLLTIANGPAEDWSRAEPGVVLPERLTHLAAVARPADELLSNFGGDIGDQSLELDSPPPSPREMTGNPIGRAGAEVRRGIARLVGGLAAGMGGLAGNAQGGRLQQWAARTIGQYAAAMQAQRNKEIARLLNLLERDPDQGLKFALPMSSVGAHRGIAAPTNYLGSRNTDFQLSRLGGGGPVDPWDLPMDYRAELSRRYRELANRELGLGRHRRAAYILAELLGDLLAAAAALKSGRHFHEAAALYRERLNNPRAAAECYRQAGLLSDAIGLYVELGEFVQAGDLYRQLERPEEADEQYRRAVERLSGSGDKVAAARVLDEKLAVPDEALRMLESAWPYSPQAKACLGEWYSMAARHGRHTESAARTRGIQADAVASRLGVWVVEVLADVSGTYPDQAVRENSADAARVVAGKMLPQSSVAETACITAAVARTFPADLLLGRDCQRFARTTQLGQRSRPTIAPAPRMATNSRKLEATRVVSISDSVEWQTAVQAAGVIFAAGLCDDHLSLARIQADGIFNVFAPRGWLLHGGSESLRFRLAVHGPSPRFDLDVYALGGSFYPQVAKSHFAPDAVATLHAENITCMDLAGEDDSVWRLSRRQSGIVLECSRRNGVLVSTALIYGDGRDLDTAAGHVLWRDDILYAGVDRGLWTVKSPRETLLAVFAHPITGLAGSLPKTRPRIAVAMREGAAVYWGGFDGGRIEPVASDMQCPQVCFTRRGRLIAVSRGRGEIYATNNQRAVLEQTFDFPHTPVAILEGDDGAGFVILSREGRLVFYGG